MTTNNTDKSKKRAGNVLSAFTLLFIIASVMVIIRIIQVQYFWEPDPKYISYFQPKRHKQEIEPERGSIIDHNGKLLAMSTPLYNVYMDCYVRKETHEADTKNGDEKEAKWVARAKELAAALPKVLVEEGHSAAYYENLILEGRRKKRKYVPIVRGIDHGKLLQLRELPLFCEGRYYSGMIEEKVDTRQYPYDELAKRVIGYVKHNNDTNSRHIGVEGKYDYILHGTKGYVWKRITDNEDMIVDNDSTALAVKDGSDVRLTLDINIQDIADRALRRNIGDAEHIAGGCVVVLDVETGAVRAMVNLQKNKKGEFKEVFNMAAGRPSEPGSVFKTVSLTTLIEDGHIKLDTEIPTNHGIMKDMPKARQDEYIINHERRTGLNTITVQRGFEISSNYVFSRLVKDFYGEKPEEFINRLHEYNFGEAYEFELSEQGSAKPRIPDPKSSTWTIYDLITTAYGYSVRVTPLQVASFYNAIANNGKMMKPYVVESIERNGKVIEEFKPSILNGSICSKATADSVTAALKMVTLEGTASKLKNSKFTVAGKTGTSRVHLTSEERAGSSNPYSDINGRKKHQATFVGFFPADEPKYTAIVVLYSGLISGNLYGGSLPAQTFKDIADELWAYEDEDSRQLRSRGEVPKMMADHFSTSKDGELIVPDVKGLGLKDALYAIENNGYRCKHLGVGHVSSQTPAPGSKLNKGETINIVLK